MLNLKELLFKLTGNEFFQQVLSRIAHQTQELMGIGSASYAESSGEKGVFRVLRKTRQSSYSIFDVGANTGQYLHQILKHFGNENFDIHCFEPSKSTFMALANNAPAIEAIKLNNFALGKEKGEARLYFDENNSSLASLTKRRLDHFNINFGLQETVEIDTVDNYCNNENISKISLLKIDVEGHELDVLAGASRMFEQKAVDLVTFEFGGCNIDTRSFFQDFYYFFQNVGMNISRITPSGYLYPIHTYSEILEQFRTTNFVASRLD
jgi:FkbM family methyltransferase